MSTYAEDVSELISTQIEVALKKEYNRGWEECIKYYWKKRGIDEDRIGEAFKKYERVEQALERQQDYDRFEKGVEKDYKSSE